MDCGQVVCRREREILILVVVGERGGEGQAGERRAHLQERIFWIM